MVHTQNRYDVLQDSFSDEDTELKQDKAEVQTSDNIHLVIDSLTENLTRHRYDLLKRLNTLRVDRKIHSFWTHDGSVLVKETERSRPLVVKIVVNIINKATHFDIRTGNYSLLDPILITDSISIIDSDTIIL